MVSCPNLGPGLDPDLDTLKDTLQGELTAAASWFYNNKLMLNLSKTKLMFSGMNDKQLGGH